MKFCEQAGTREIVSTHYVPAGKMNEMNGLQLLPKALLCSNLQIEN